MCSWKAFSGVKIKLSRLAYNYFLYSKFYDFMDLYSLIGVGAVFN